MADKIQLFGYEATCGHDITPQAGGGNLFMPTYLADVETGKGMAEVVQRLHEMDALLTACKVRETPEVDCLKVIGCPEFYLQSKRGRLYAHEFATFLKGLQRLLRSKNMTDWVVLPGTCIMLKHGTMEWLTKRFHTGGAGGEQGFQVNVAPLLYQGQVSLIMKQHVSGIDTVAWGRRGWGANDIQLGAYRYQLQNAQTLRERISLGEYVQQRLHSEGVTSIPQHRGIVVIDQVTIGVEVCLDHAYGLLQVLAQDRATRNGTDLAQGGVDLHVVLSSGMKFQKKYSATKNNGIGMNVDGTDVHTNWMVKEGPGGTATPDTRITNYQNPSNAVRLQRAANNPCVRIPGDLMGNTAQIPVHGTLNVIRYSDAIDLLPP